MIRGIVRHYYAECRLCCERSAPLVAHSAVGALRVAQAGGWRRDKRNGLLCPACVAKAPVAT